MDTVIVSAKNYDEALTKALIELGTTSDNVDINVKEKGSSGFLGIFGAKPWTIEVSVKKSADEEIVKAKKNKVFEHSAKRAKPFEEKQEKTMEKSSFTDRETEIKKEEAKEKIKEETSLKAEITDEYDRYYGEKESVTSKRHILTNDELENIRNISDRFLKDFFNAMNLKANVVYDFSFKTNELSVVIESDEDMGVIIGKRGQTLDSLQYILSLIINKSSESFVRVKLDTENYRRRRKEKLEILARNIASRVKKTGRFTELEPMNAYERRIIHAALQGDSMVSTKSVGEDPFRHITIYPKRNYKSYKKNIRRETNQID